MNTKWDLHGKLKQVITRHITAYDAKWQKRHASLAIFHGCSADLITKWLHLSRESRWKWRPLCRFFGGGSVALSLEQESLTLLGKLFTKTRCCKENIVHFEREKRHRKLNTKALFIFGIHDNEIPTWEMQPPHLSAYIFAHSNPYCDMEITQHTVTRQMFRYISRAVNGNATQTTLNFQSIIQQREGKK